MDIFNIKIFLQNTIWGSILTVIKVILVLYIIYRLLRFMKGQAERLGIIQPCTVPGINTQFLYPYLLISIYKKSTPECPAMCALLETLVGFCSLYGKDGLFGGHLFLKPCVVFFKAEAVEALLGNAEETEKSDEYLVLRASVGDGLLTSQSTKWRKQRKLLTPTFHFSILEDCIPIFQEQASVLISIIKSRMQEPWIDIVPLSSLCSLDIICQTAMGISMNIQNGGNSDLMNAVTELQEATMYRILRPWLYNDFIFNLTAVGKKFKSHFDFCNEFNQKVLKQKMDMMTKEDRSTTFDNKSNRYSLGKKLRKPFIELLLEHYLRDPSFTENDVRDEVNTFMSAGFDTTAKSLSWVLYCLGIYPEVQRKVHEELDELLTNEEDETISREVLSKMKYLECVIKETLRIYPVAPMYMRKSQKTLKVSNYTVKKGTLCLISVWQLHRDPLAFQDPEKFIPERFLPENSAGRHPYAYIPFSAGPRNCIGQKFAMMEMKTILACVLRHFRVKSLDPRDKVLVCPNITLRNVNPLRLKFEGR